jgi:hypothetical protein
MLFAEAYNKSSVCLDPDHHSGVVARKSKQIFSPLKTHYKKQNKTKKSLNVVS